ncbi:hypothetical protein ACH5RR_034262 [Cinchona calisaya]|uniref:Uncharacterized protein n=1 Tax=Cinchona calisaya TaxID=153742 RepID=A0ABD2YBP4_9GENT
MDKDGFRSRELDGGLGSRGGDDLWDKLWQLGIPPKRVSLPTNCHSCNTGMTERIQGLLNSEIAEMIVTRRDVEFGAEINISDVTW